LNSFVPRPLDIHKSYTLDTVRKLMELFGNPQNELRIVHVAGTSGKTSTSYYAAALLRGTGKKVGLTVSPHITEVNERVQIDGIPLPEAEFCADLESFIARVETAGIEPTYYELLMAFAFYKFAKYGVDYAVVEVGLGGLLDSSNIARRADKICILTDIGLDHMHILGNTLPEIAAQKAGIMHEQNEAFSYRQSEDVMEVFREVAKQNHANLHELDQISVPTELGFLPEYQKRNIMLAQSATDFALRRDFGQAITPEILLDAAKIQVPGRMEIFRKDGKTIVLDGAHNPQKLGMFARSFRARFGDKPASALVGFTASREHALADNIAEVAGIAQSIIATNLPNAQDLPHKSLDPQTVQEEASKQLGEQAFTAAEADPDVALDRLLARPEELLIVTGSFFLVSKVRERLA
jgi:dihydrofolate synthase/folylpolyglutamate synthase